MILPTAEKRRFLYVENTIEIRHLSKSYGGVPAVSDLSLTVGRGEVFGLLGANGAGKSLSLIHI